MKSALVASVLVVVCAGTASAQPAAVDFRSDVQPIFREHCYSCHGPELQMNGFRLDRRADAMRGGGQSNIGPGNADGSRLFQRVAGTSVGPQMPPSGPLRADQIAIIKHWIDEGARWPDELSGEVPVPPADAASERLIAALREGDQARIDELLKNRAVIGKWGRHGIPPLVAAAQYGSADHVQRMLAAGADPNARTPGGVTALMAAIPSVAKVRLLLDAGADVNAHSDDARSAVLIASGTAGAAPVLKMLLDAGADPFRWTASEPSPLREAARLDDVEMFRLLMSWGVPARGPGAPSALVIRMTCAECAAAIGAGAPLTLQPPPPSPGLLPATDAARAVRAAPVPFTWATPAAIRAAVERSLPLLQKIDADFIKRTGCVSCHHNSLVSMAVTTAKSRGFRVDDGITGSQNVVISRYLESWRERALQNVPIAGSQDTMSYILFGLAASGYMPDAATDAQALWLKRRQASDGRWPLQTLRPPIESNDIEVTAVTIRALQAFAPPSQRAEYGKAIERARAWLESARGETTEERAFRLLGLTWSEARPEALAAAAREVVAVQLPDGGWPQAAGMPSDAYATGQALVALRESRAATASDGVFQRGVEWLLRTQFADGTWYVDSRSVPIQPYFESGFPYGTRQWISAAGTAWAVTALALGQ